MEVYIFKSTVCLAFLLLFYKLLLENEIFHLFKRFYLLGSIIVAGIIPGINFPVNMATTDYRSAGAVLQSLEFLNTDIEVKIDYVSLALWFCYGLGVLFFLIRFVNNLGDIMGRIRKNEVIKGKNYNYILLDEKMNPHTFLNYIFLNRSDFECQQIPEEVLDHEKAHATQYHSLDVIVVEFLQIIFWFNPVVFFLKEAIRLNHEFLADRAVLEGRANTVHYKKTLLRSSLSDMNNELAAPFSYVSIKKRFSLMNKKGSSRTARLKLLLLGPLFMGLLYSFGSRDIIVEDQRLGNATPEMIEEYNRLATFYNSSSIPSDKTKNFHRMMAIYSVMTSNQKKAAVALPIAFGVKASGNDPLYQRNPSIPVNPPIPEDPSIPEEPKDYFEMLSKRGAIFLYEDRILPLKEAQTMVKGNPDLFNFTLSETPDGPVIRIVSIEV